MVTDMHALFLFGLLHPFLQRMPREVAFEALRESVERQYMSEAELDAVVALWAAADASGARKGETNELAQEVEELSDP